VRVARGEDIEALCDLYHEFHAYHVRGVPDRLISLSVSDPGERRNLVKRIGTVLSEDDSEILVAVLGGRVIGLAEVYVREDEPNVARVSHRFGYLQSLAVADAYRARGAGQALLRYAEGWARDRGATEMRVDIWEFDGGPLEFYERSGFRTLRRMLVRQLGEG
jgi:GNAT superfamily N-acetyltransferase